MSTPIRSWTEWAVRRAAIELDTLENKQCTRQAQMYSTVLSRIIDARGNIISNNMSVLLKNLAIINVIFLPLHLLASIGGMPE